MSLPLNYVCNETVSTGILPDRLKYSIINPLYKKGNERDVSNYRPVSLLISFSKMF